MSSIGLVLCFPFTWPPHGDPERVRQAFERTYLPFIATMEEHPVARATVHLTGGLLEWMTDNAPEALRSLVALAQAGRIEVLGGLWGGALLPAVPERDAVGQIQATTRWWRGRHDVRPRGAWLPYCGWDPAAARILGRLGLQYTVLEEAQFHPPVAGDGYYLTEREGQGLALFVSDTQVSWMIPDAEPARVVKALQRRVAAGRKCVTLTIPGEALGAADESVARRCFGSNGWLPTFFKLVAENGNWLKPVTGGTVLDRMRPTDRAWPPPSVSLPVATAALGGTKAGEFEAIVSEMRRHQVPDLVRCGPFLRAGSWEGLLVHHPEVNRLHKRMLRASLDVLRLRSIVRDARGDRDPRFGALEEATLALYKGQLAAAYVVGSDVGAQDPTVRHYAFSSLLRAERLVAFALGEADKLRREQVDYDCDGRAEILVRSQHLGAIVAPSEGGALVELDVWSLPGNVQNVRTRRPETEHEELIQTENLPRIAIEPQAVPATADIEEITETLLDVRELPPLKLAQRNLADHIHPDRHVRSSFVDHFLGPDASLDNTRRGRFPEAGDFVGADYQLLQVEDTPGGGLQVSLARDGMVTEGTALRLVRVSKRYDFHPEMPVVDVRYEIANRYHEPIRTRFAVEFNLGLDGNHGEDMALVVAGVRCPLRSQGEVEGVSEVAVVDQRRGWQVVLHFSTPALLWHHPVETVSRSPKGLSLQFQGTAIVASWPVELWGLERQRLDISMTVES